MKKAACLLCAFLLLFFSSCSMRLIDRGKWKDGVYYNDYGQFKIVTNDYFEIYTDEKIKENLGAVYPADNVLNDMVISSEYCAVIVTLERPAVSYTQSEYVSQFILNTQKNSENGTYDLADPFSQTIAGKQFTCVAVRYLITDDVGTLGYFEYDYILKTESGVFVILRITAGTEDHVATALGMIREIDDQT